MLYTEKQIIHLHLCILIIIRKRYPSISYYVWKIIWMNKVMGMFLKSFCVKYIYLVINYKCRDFVYRSHDIWRAVRSNHMLKHTNCSKIVESSTENSILQNFIWNQYHKTKIRNLHGNVAYINSIWVSSVFSVRAFMMHPAKMNMFHIRITTNKLNREKQT